MALSSSTVLQRDPPEPASWRLCYRAGHTGSQCALVDVYRMTRMTLLLARDMNVIIPPLLLRSFGRAVPTIRSKDITETGGPSGPSA